MQLHVKRLRTVYLNRIPALYKFRFNNNNVYLSANLAASHVAISRILTH